MSTIRWRFLLRALSWFAFVFLPSAVEAQCSSFDPPCDDALPVISIAPAGGQYYGPSRSITVSMLDDHGLNAGSFTLSGATLGPGSPQFSPQTTNGTAEATVTLQVGVNTVVTATVCEALPWNQRCVSATETFSGASVPPPVAGRGAPTISAGLHNAENRSVDACVATCFDIPVSYNTVPYMSLDAARAVTLVYNLDRVLGTALVTVDASENSTDRPVKMSLRVRRPDGTYYPFYANGNPTEIFFATGSGTTGRLSGWITPGWTGAYQATAVVANHWSDGTRIEDSMPLRVLELGDIGPYGAGWGIAGLERLLCQGSQCDILLTSGDGSVSYFTRSTGNSYISPKGDFSQFSIRSSSSDGNWFDRKWPDSTWATYDWYGRMTSVTDRFGNRVSYTYNSTSIQLASITDPAGLVTQLFYDAAGMLDYVRDPGGRVTQVTVNAGGDLAEIYESDGVKALEVGYTGWHVPLYSINRIGARTDYSYSATKLAWLTLPTITVNGQGVRPQMRLMSLEEQLVNTDPALGSSSNPAPWRNPANLHIKLFAPNGDSTLYQPHRLGPPTSRAFRDPQGRWQTEVFDRNLDGLVYYTRNSSGDAWSLLWEGPNLKYVYEHASAARRRFEYEQTYGQVTETFVNDQLIRTNYYGPLGRLDSARVGSAMTKFTYDGRGRTLTIRDPEGNLTSKAYQTTGSQNLQSVTSPAGSGFTGVTTWVYDIHGRPQSTSDPTARNVTITYDSLNRPITITGPLGARVQYAYNDLARTYTITDPKNQVYTQTTNALGWDETLTDSRGGIERFSYDVQGNVLLYTNRRGQEVSSTFDSYDRVTSRTADGQATYFAYDSLFRWVRASNGESVDTLFYDAAGQLVDAVTVRSGVRHVVHSGYSAGIRTEVRLQQGTGTPKSAFAGVDALLRLDRLWDFAGKQTQIAYTSRSQPAQITLPTGSGPAFRLQRTHLYTGSTALSRLSYNHALPDSLLARWYVRDTLDRMTLASQGQADRMQRTLRYDVLGRLTYYRDVEHWIENGQLICPDPLDLNSCYYEPIHHYDTRREQTFAFDSVGNRRDLGAVVELGNRLTSFNGYTMQYDADGNLTSKSKSGFSQTLSWNALGQLTQAITNGATTTFGYDAFGRRVRKTSGSVTTRYLWDNLNLIAELDAAGNRVREYTYYPGLDLPHSVRRVSDGAVFYYASDASGNVTGLVNAANTVVNQYDYTPHGESISVQEGVPQPLRFAGRELDPETGLQYVRARYYDPQVARFVSEDPLGLEGGINAYAYASGDPANATDPLGLIECPAGYHYEFSTARVTFENGQVVSINVTHWCAPNGGGSAGGGGGGGGGGPSGSEPGPVSNGTELTGGEAGLIQAVSGRLGNAGPGALALGFFAFTIPLPGRHVATAGKLGKAALARKLAQLGEKAYPKLGTKIQLHHILPIRLGGLRSGPTVPLPAGYHQFITNAFRSLWPQGTGTIPNAAQLDEIMRRVYDMYPIWPFL